MYIGRWLIEKERWWISIIRKRKKERLGRETTSEICLIYARKLEVIISVLGE